MTFLFVRVNTNLKFLRKFPSSSVLRVPSLTFPVSICGNNSRHKNTYLHRRLPQRFFSIVPQLPQTAFCHINKRNNNNNNLCIMGSINCKEYVTTTSNEGCANRPGSGTTGSYQSTAEDNMAAPKPMTPTSEYTDAVVVCQEGDIQENEMKQLDFDENTKILLVKQNGKLTAIGNKCSHYGAPLHTGVLGQGRVRCPWHGACFNIETGDIEDFPGLDSLPCYHVQVTKEGEVKVRAKRKDLENGNNGKKRIKTMATYCEHDQRTYVVVGGGPAGAICVETLRQEGFTGRIVMICREKNLPYDRVKISKSMDIAIETIQLRNASFYAEHSIEVMLDVMATRLDAIKKTVDCSNGYQIKFDKIFIATGCRSFRPPIKGVNLTNVCTVRDHSEANDIHSLLNPDMNVVCLGSSFIALESAAYMANKVKSVTVVGRPSFPLSQNFGDKIGERVHRLFEENGVKMIGDSGITEIIANIKGEVAGVKLKDDSTLQCDLLILGTGSTFYTDFLKESGIAINPNGSIDTDMHLMTNIPDVYVGGDIANAPIYPIANERATIGHYGLASYHGRIAAINMAGCSKELQAVPFFFTMIFGKGIRYAGYGKFEDVFIEGDLEALKFVAYFLDAENNVVSVASCGRDPIVAQFAELLSQGKRLHRSDVEGKEPGAWANVLKSS